MNKSNKIKVLHVIGSLNIGGAETVAMNYYRYIDRAKYEFHYLVNGSEIGEYEHEVIKRGGKVIHIDYPKNGWLKYYNKLLRLMKKEKYDIVHGHTLFSSGLTMLAAKNAGIQKRISHSHSTQNKGYTNIALNIYEYIMRKLIIKYSTDILSASIAAGNYLFGEKNFEKYGEVLINGIDLDKFEYNSVKRNKIRGNLELTNKIVLGHVGHIATVKNQEYLIQILSLLRNKKYTLLLIGEGTNRKKLTKKIDELGLTNQVIFTGNVDNVHDYLNAIDIFLFPSLFEGFGISVIEAQANGLPCIISNKLPDEVEVTNLIKRLPIQAEAVSLWINEINITERPNTPEKYANVLKQAGFDVAHTSKKIADIYEK